MLGVPSVVRFVVLVVAFADSAAAAVPITYQGQLVDSGSPAAGTYDMEFVLSDSPVLGLFLQSVVIDDVVVEDGLFAVEIEFNDVWFDGSDRWLQIRVEGVSLSPRQEITYAPYAIRAARATIANDLETPWVTNTDTNVIDATSSRSTAIRARQSSVSLDEPAVFAQADSSAGGSHAIYGRQASLTPGGFSAAIRGEHVARGGNGIGVYGSQEGGGWGVYGTAPMGVGIFGNSTEGTGVRGQSSSGIGVAAVTGAGSSGLFAQASGGVGADAITTSGEAAVRGTHSGAGTIARLGTPDYAVEARNEAVEGEGTAIFASAGNTAIVARAVPDGFGPGLERIGVSALAGGFSSGAMNFIGVRGVGQNPAQGGGRTAIGVYGGAQIGTTANEAYGVYGETFGQGPSQYAGFFAGDVHVLGTLSKSSGSFKIDHPMDPENMYLSHSFVESPDMANLYSGTVMLDNSGGAVVKLPRYFEALNTDFRYQLTAVGASMPGLFVSREVSGNSFEIGGGVGGKKVSWQVTGTRKDAAALAHPIVVEESKAERHRGRYLDPEAHGEPASKSIHPRGLGGERSEDLGG